MSLSTMSTARGPASPDSLRPPLDPLLQTRLNAMKDVMPRHIGVGNNNNHIYLNIFSKFQACFIHTYYQYVYI
jgi:hypothetical protein